MNVDYLLKGNTKKDFDAMVKYLEAKGYEFTNKKSYYDFRNVLGKKVVILVEGVTNYITGKKKC